jgi:GMP synthase (glutamine-hydrolysing)
MYSQSSKTVEKKILAIVHSQNTNTGRVGRIIKEKGYNLDIRCPRLGEDLPTTMENHDAVVIFGGPISVNDSKTLPFIQTELDWIPVCLDAQKPFLGICLGAQLLAHVLGATISPHPQKVVEIGYFPIKPTVIEQNCFQNPFYVYHWHREGFNLPKSAVLLAEGETFSNQAFRYSKNSYGLQFHPEVTEEIINAWTNGEQKDYWVNLKGAQSYPNQMKMHSLHDKIMEDWFNNFFDMWIQVS